MSSLNILCAICSQYFKDTDVIYSTRCGHVFHKCCLFQWLGHSHTCPQCRKYCVRQLCHRLFVNFGEIEACEDEPEIEVPKVFDWIYIDNYEDFNELQSIGFSYGVDEDGNDIYAARGQFNGDLIPGYYNPNKKAVIVPWGFESFHVTEDIELLDISNDDAEYKWVEASAGDIPENAFAFGTTVMGDILYSARAKHEDKILYGKLHQRYKMAYMPYKGKEVCNGEYEVLVRIPKRTSESISHESNENIGEPDVQN